MEFVNKTKEEEEMAVMNPVVTAAEHSSIQNTATATTIANTANNKRKRNNEPVLPEKAKRPRKNAPGGTNNSFRYWQVKVEKEEEGDSPILEAINANNDAISRVLPISPTSIALKFVKSKTYEQVTTMVKRGEISRMDCSAFRKLDNSRNDKKKTDKPPRPRIYPTNSFYTFTTAGETFAEKVTNVKKILNISPIKKPFSSVEQHVSPVGIRDIHFFEIDLAKGCFAVRNYNKKMKEAEPNKEKEQQQQQQQEQQQEQKPSLDDDLAKYYKGLVTNIEKIDHDKYRKLTHRRNMRRRIKSWVSICPYYATDGVPPADDFVTEKGISTYRLFDNGMGIFQFKSQRFAITPVEATKAMGAMHKSLCFQSSGNVVRKLLADNSNALVVASVGDLTYRSKWRNSDKRATKCLKFYSVADDKKITDQDILDLVNTEKMFHTIYFRGDRDYGVVKKSGNEKIVPSTIKLSDESKLRFTAITFKEFNTEKNARGMNCFNTWRKGPKAKTFGNIAGTGFGFDGLTKESLEKIMSQKRVKFLKAAKNEGEEDSYRGVVRTASSVKGCNLLPGINGKVTPEGKNSLRYKLETLENEKKLAIDFSRGKEKTTTGQADAENRREEEEEEEEEQGEEPYKEL